ncbi:unnamed protein product, partial [Mesorhabditis belari]|uniref:t-SNARE coiled-coil homology domain-containing protein n=1 Tax=Mesorhabditis belari TaxID=2138241 RepID=A0AAF3JAJ1_9BILA
MAYRGNMRGSPNNGPHFGQILEQQNDNKVDDLATKVSALKRITLDIGEEVRSQNRLLNDMDTEFDSGKGLCKER